MNSGQYLDPDHRGTSRVYNEYPELTSFESDEGLLSLDAPGLSVDPLGGALCYKQHYIYFHQFLRRNFTSNPNYHFLTELWRYHQRHPEQRVSVAIDHLRLTPIDHALLSLEKDRSFGPPLRMETLDDPHAVGLTVYRPRAAQWMHPEYDRTEFFWSFLDGLKTLQIEEVVPESPSVQLSDDHVLTRYVHSIRNVTAHTVTAHTFVHLDGAVKVYARNAWKQRFVQQLPDTIKGQTKMKVFRIDGRIPDDEWSKLISLYFQSNYMVPEYLNPAFESEG